MFDLIQKKKKKKEKRRRRFDGSQRASKICGYYGLRMPPYKLVSGFNGYMQFSLSHFYNFHKRCVNTIKSQNVLRT